MKPIRWLLRASSQMIAALEAKVELERCVSVDCSRREFEYANLSQDSTQRNGQLSVTSSSISVPSEPVEVPSSHRQII